MNRRQRIVLHLAWMLAATCVAACQQTGSRSNVPEPSSSSSAPRTPELPSEAPRQAPAVTDSPGKPLPPIDFEYELLGEPIVGQPLEIRVTSRMQTALDALNVALSGDERMQVPAEMARFRMARAAANVPMTRTIRVTPLASGTLYLNVLLQAQVDGRLQSRAVTIPIRVGTESQPGEAAGTLSTDADGQPIISLPASEN